jgi:hypothetical protein
MDPISGLAALYEILKRRATDRAPSTDRSSGSTRTDARAAPLRTSFEELQRQIRLKLASLPKESLASPATKRWVIGTLLSWELHEDSRNEPKFAALVQGVQQSIDADARLKARFERVMEELSG